MRANIPYLNEIPQDHVPVGLQHSKGHEEHELRAVVICPENFPQPKDILKGKLPLEGNENPSTRSTSVMDPMQRKYGTTYRKQKNRFKPSAFSAP